MVKKISSGNLFFVLTSLSILFFFLLILIPSTFVLSYPIRNWQSTRAVFLNPGMMRLIFDSLNFSFKVAFLVTALDLLLGLPVAWVLARHNFFGKSILEALFKLPLSVPTSALGLSVVFFWTKLSTFLSAFLLVTLVHLAFSFPYIITNLAVVLAEVNRAPEEAARTLGASVIAAVRTITIPLVKRRIVSATILTFTRSLSETGATIIALTMAGSLVKTAPVLIASWKKTSSPTELVAATAVVSTILIILSTLLFFLVRLLLGRIKIFGGFSSPRIEPFLSSREITRLRNLLIFPLVFVVVVLPSFFIISQFRPSSLSGYSQLFKSLGASFAIAAAVTSINLITGFFMAFFIARGKFKRLVSFLDTLIDIPLIIPTSALGFSLALFWQARALSFSYFFLVTLAHLAFTYPYVVKPLVAAFQETDFGCEEAARTLGASPLMVIKTITFPLIVPSLEASAIMAFTRSLSETGATIAVAPAIITAPVYIVNLVTLGKNSQAVFPSVVLIVFSFFIFLMTRKLTKSKTYL